MLRLEGISKRYQGETVLHPLTLTFPERSTSVLIGPSGSGKSTILRLIIGLITPDSGTIHLQEEPVTAANITSLRHRIGYVIQEGGLFPHLTAFENVTLLATHLRWNPDRINTRVSELAQLLCMSRELLQRYPGELSGGQRQRVSLMRALLPDPELLLLDEPLGALDPMTRRNLQRELREIFRTLGKTVILVTHDMAEAGFFGDLIMLLRDGRLVQQGDLHSLLAVPADPFVEQFIGAQRDPWREFAALGGG